MIFNIILPTPVNVKQTSLCNNPQNNTIFWYSFSSRIFNVHVGVFGKFSEHFLSFKRIFVCVCVCVCVHFCIIIIKSRKKGNKLIFLFLYCFLDFIFLVVHFSDFSRIFLLIFFNSLFFSSQSLLNKKIHNIIHGWTR